MFVQKPKSQSLKERSDKIRSVFTSAYQDMNSLIQDQEKLNEEIEARISELKEEQQLVKDNINANARFLSKLRDFVV